MNIKQTIFNLISPDTVAAACNGYDTSILPCEDIWGILELTLTILTAGVGVLAVGGIIYGAILYSSAGDNSGQVQKAKEIIRNVVIGLIVFLGMYTFISFLIPGGIFS
jgi:hypothetical protein